MQLEPIETAPHSGAFIILHDQEKGLYEVARWVKADGCWGQEHGDPVTLNPTHWTYFPEGHGSVATEQGNGRGNASEFARPPAPARERRSGGRMLATCCSTVMSAIMALGLLGLSLLNTLSSGQ